MTANVFLIFSLLSGVMIASVAKYIGKTILLEEFKWVSWLFAVDGFFLGIRTSILITKMFVT